LVEAVSKQWTGQFKREYKYMVGEKLKQ
jgi:hypothetical protein